MNCKTKLAALAMSAVLGLSLTACGGDTTWVAKANGSTMSAGVYILNQIDAFYDAQDAFDAAQPEDAASSQAESADKEAKALLKATIDGKTGSQYVADATIQYVKAFFAAEKLFDEKGMTLGTSDEETLAANNEIVWQYSSDFYEQNGISKQSVSDMTHNYMKQNLLFAALYGEDGEKAIPESEYENYFKESRVRVRYIPFNLVSQQGQPLAEEEAKKVEETANAYFERAKNGEDLIKLIDEYQNALIEENRKAAAEAGQEVPEAGEPLVSEPGEYDLLITRDSTSPSKILTDEMFAAPENVVRLVRESRALYLAMRVDPMFSREDYEGSKNAMLKEMKQEEFDAWLAEQGNSIEITYNDAALKRYTPEKLKFDLPESN